MKKVLTKYGSYAAAGAVSLFSMAQVAMAQQTGNFTPSSIHAIQLQSGTAVALAANIVNVILWVAGLLAVVYLIWGGIMYITAGGDAEKATKGRVAITNAIIGIIIIIAALAIYRTVVGSVSSGTAQ